MRPWKVADVMTKKVITVPKTAQYAELVSTLATHKISSVPVVDNAGRVIGVVSEADLLRKIEFLGRDTEPQILEWGTPKVNRAKAKAATAEELMTAPAVTTQPGVSVVLAARRMDHKHVKHMPVVDAFDHLQGVVSRADLLKMYLRADTAIRQDVVDNVIKGLLHLDPLAVEVDVLDGAVSLNGQVERRSTAQIAVTVTTSVPGVIRVVDHLRWTRDDLAATHSS